MTTQTMRAVFRFPRKDHIALGAFHKRHLSTVNRHYYERFPHGAFAYVRLKQYSRALRVYKFLNSLFFHGRNALPHLLVTLDNVMRRSMTAMGSYTGQLNECSSAGHGIKGVQLVHW